ncbi:MAG: twin-arginine translocase TatA/TatE family subunit [Candidatus Acidiferrales bacterium]|jgi:sec-independent protein translocase protein TatB
MLSFPHLVVLFVIALVVFGPEKLPELARMLGKATAEFRKMTNDFRYALEDEVRELDRQKRIRDEEIASATRAAQSTTTVPEGTVQRSLPAADAPIPFETPQQPSPDTDAAQPKPQEAVNTSHEKASDDDTAV